MNRSMIPSICTRTPHLSRMLHLVRASTQPVCFRRWKSQATPVPDFWGGTPRALLRRHHSLDVNHEAIIQRLGVFHDGEHDFLLGSGKLFQTICNAMFAPASEKNETKLSSLLDQLVEGNLKNEILGWRDSLVQSHDGQRDSPALKGLTSARVHVQQASLLRLLVLAQAGGAPTPDSQNQVGTFAQSINDIAALSTSTAGGDERVSPLGYSVAFASALLQGAGTVNPGNISPAMFSSEACIRASVLASTMEQQRQVAAGGHPSGADESPKPNGSSTGSTGSTSTHQSKNYDWIQTPDKDPSWTPRQGPALDLSDAFMSALHTGLERRQPVYGARPSGDGSGTSEDAGVIEQSGSILEAGSEVMRRLCLERLKHALPALCDTPAFGLVPAHSAHVLFSWAFGYGDGTTGVRGEEVRAIRIEGLEAMYEARRSDMEAFFDERAMNPDVSEDEVAADRKIALERLQGIYNETKQEIEAEALASGGGDTMTTASGDKGRIRKVFAELLAIQGASIAAGLRPELYAAGTPCLAGMFKEKEEAESIRSQDVLATFAQQSSLQHLRLTAASAVPGQPLPAGTGYQLTGLEENLKSLQILGSADDVTCMGGAMEAFIQTRRLVSEEHLRHHCLTMELPMERVPLAAVRQDAYTSAPIHAHFDELADEFSDQDWGSYPLEFRGCADASPFILQIAKLLGVELPGPLLPTAGWKLVNIDGAVSSEMEGGSVGKAVHKFVVRQFVESDASSAEEYVLARLAPCGRVMFHTVQHAMLLRFVLGALLGPGSLEVRRFERKCIDQGWCSAEVLGLCRDAERAIDVHTPRLFQRTSSNEDNAAEICRDPQDPDTESRGKIDQTTPSKHDDTEDTGTKSLDISLQWRADETQRALEVATELIGKACSADELGDTDEYKEMHAWLCQQYSVELSGSVAGLSDELASMLTNLGAIGSRLIGKQMPLDVDAKRAELRSELQNMAENLRDPYIVAVGFAFKKFAQDSITGSTPSTRGTEAEAGIDDDDKLQQEAGTKGLVQQLDAMARPGVSKRLAVPPLGPDRRVYTTATADWQLAHDVVGFAWEQLSSQDGFDGKPLRFDEQAELEDMRASALAEVQGESSVPPDHVARARTMKFVPERTRGRGGCISRQLQYRDASVSCADGLASDFGAESDSITVLEVHHIGDQSTDFESNSLIKPASTPTWARNLWHHAAIRALQSQKKRREGSN